MNPLRSKWLSGVLIAAVLACAWLVLRGHPVSGVHQQAVYYCPMHPTYTSDRSGSCPICNMALVPREPAVVSQHSGHSENTPLKSFTVQEILDMKPGEICLLHKCKMGKCMIAMTPEMARLGKCPHCGEDLGVVVKDAGPAGYASVNLAPDKQQLIGITLKPAVRQGMEKEIRTSGKIAYDPELYQAEEEYLQAVAASAKAAASDVAAIRDQAAQLVESAGIKLKLLGLNEELIAELVKAGKPDRSLFYAEPGRPVWVYARIYEYELPYVKPGTAVEVTIPSVPGHLFKGTLRALDSVVDQATRTVRARAVLDNLEGLLKPEMYVDVVIRVSLGEVLTVPSEAVFETGTQKIVFVRKADGIFEPREVTLGARSENIWEIKSGITEGEEVVTSGNFLIDSESRLRAAIQGLGSGSGAGGHQHGS